MLILTIWCTGFVECIENLIAVQSDGVQSKFGVQNLIEAQSDIVQSFLNVRIVVQSVRISSCHQTVYGSTDYYLIYDCE